MEVNLCTFSVLFADASVLPTVYLIISCRITDFMPVVSCQPTSLYSCNVWELKDACFTGYYVTSAGPPASYCPTLRWGGISWIIGYAAFIFQVPPVLKPAVLLGRVSVIHYVILPRFWSRTHPIVNNRWVLELARSCACANIPLAASHFIF